jgi:hypothetical protein
VRLDEFVTAPLDGALLGECSPPGREDAGRAVPLALLVADLIPLVGWRGDGGTTTIQAMYYASLSAMASWFVTRTPHEFRMGSA